MNNATGNNDIILVNERDEQTGIGEKMAVHKQGLLHRAFSVFIFNKNGEMLLQQRSMNKYHSPGLWTNTCCSHPLPGEETINAANRRLHEEMGFQTQLEEVFDFIYKADMENGLIEHELDHVFVGEYDGSLHLAADEVMEYRYATMEELKRELLEKPGQFTAWFNIAFPRIYKWWEQSYDLDAQQPYKSEMK